jgi:iron(III) transport system ATP-binding protein
MSSVTVRDVSKSFGALTVLDHLDLHVPDGSITALLGPSGCGKTTLLRIVAGFVRADSGTVMLDDRVVELGTGVAVPPEKRGVGYVPQEGALFPHLNVAANILFGLPRGQRTKARLAELLDLAELPATVAKRPPHELSGGQQQRVALARALAPEPRVILLDEPFSSLDAGLRVSAGREVSRVLRHAGATALLVTHDQGEALSLADQVAVMRNGKVVQLDSPAGLYERPADPEIAGFVGGASVVPGRVRSGVADTVLGALRTDCADGSARVLIRPEQLLLAIEADPGVKATVSEVSYYGAQVVVHLSLDDGTELTARGPSARTPTPGDRVAVRVEGAVVAYPDGTAG